ncbi:MmcQ/YjbR family DNA-binding protein [Zongyangia hominis]|uniref:MmcQ/YjbR family DNA-binding protein n=1 Tax=Zongyangia hominis TaxID=2763677 RepID=A0A926EC31_9FIRM|nr:MmcQ/YjbR family DNA-binding protein [Zongyangia hominis]MBC8570323.1 MmcQ/YjbR family DNA-binding protein [Zongyangia hominis]
MKTKEEAVGFCLTYPDAYEDYPFEGGEWTVMRHKSNKKSFCLIFEREGRIWLNLKCEPMRADFLRRAYLAVIPAYHMNKVHWNSVILDGSVPEEEIESMITHSYELTSPRRPAPRQKATR